MGTIGFMHSGTAGFVNSIFVMSFIFRTSFSYIFAVDFKDYSRVKKSS